ncbi:cleft lip and palate transmembrane protein 1-domain-containing protein, partial [Jimgerdemannia flammicorona]
AEIRLVTVTTNRGGCFVTIEFHTSPHPLHLAAQMPPPQDNGDRPAENQTFWEKWSGTIFRFIFIWALMRMFSGAQKPAPPAANHGDGISSTLGDNAHASHRYFPVLPSGVYYSPFNVIPPKTDGMPTNMIPLWQGGVKMVRLNPCGPDRYTPSNNPDLLLYISETEYFTDYSSIPALQSENIEWGDWNDERTVSFDIPTTLALSIPLIRISHQCIQTIQNNGTIYAHIFLRKHNAPLDPEDPKFVVNQVVYFRHLPPHRCFGYLASVLNKYYPKRRVVKQKKLLDSLNKADEQHIEDDDQTENEEQFSSPLLMNVLTHWYTSSYNYQQASVGGSILQLGNWTRRAPLASYWHRNLTLNIISDTNQVIPIYSVPPIVQRCKYFEMQSTLVGLTLFDLHLEKSGASDKSGKLGFYLPIIYPNDFWNLKDHAFAINETIDTLPLTIIISPLSYFKFQIYAGFAQSIEQQQASAMGGATAGEMDEVKVGIPLRYQCRSLRGYNGYFSDDDNNNHHDMRILNVGLGARIIVALTFRYLPLNFRKYLIIHHAMHLIQRMLLETNPILLGTTIVVSLFHSLFEFLAFKNDITFWNKKQDMTGVSIRTLFVNIFFQIVIFLYLMDNNQETSWMILIGQGFGLLIEVWKVWKALKFEVVRVPNSVVPYRVRFSDAANNLTETESKTAEYDQQAYKYLSWITYPLLFGYAAYSLLYDEHKSWYSYVLGTLVGFVYMFGFITMTPSLFINYKLKSVCTLVFAIMAYHCLFPFSFCYHVLFSSCRAALTHFYQVAHMPWKTMMYKSLNTFIDDLFAFCIKMPTLHRLACLRDDVVFFVYLYQRWAYRIDHTRANEYGQVGMEGEATDETTVGKEVIESKKNK